MANRLSRTGRVRNVAVGLVVVMVVAHVTAIQLRQRAWQAAARTRETVLDNAFQTLADAGCETVTVRDIPETVDGVHLFRNGFAEAARARGLVLRQVPFGGDCEFAWTSGGFVRVTRER